MLSVNKDPKVSRHTRNLSGQYSYICFAPSPLVVDSKLFHRVQLPGCGSPLVPHTQVPVDM